MAQNSAKTGDILMIKKRRKPLIHKAFQRFLLPAFKNGVVAGVAGFEPTNAAVKVLCLTA